MTDRQGCRRRRCLDESAAANGSVRVRLVGPLRRRPPRLRLGKLELDDRRPVSLARSTCFSDLTSSREREAFSRDCKPDYNYVLPNRFVIGAEADASFPSIQNPEGISIGGTSTFSSPLGPESYSETVLSSGTLRGRIGYAPGNWLLYATGGFAWTYDQLTLTQLATGTTDMPFLWRLGWAAGAGVEVPVAPHWTASIQYLYTDYGHSNALFANAGQRFDSDLSLQELRAGLNYQFGDDGLRRTVSAPTTGPGHRQFSRSDYVHLAGLSGISISL